MDGTDYTVRYAVGLDANGKWIYDDQLMQIEKGELLAREANSGSKNALSTKDDIAFVNKLQEILINDATFDKNNYYKAKDAEYEEAVKNGDKEKAIQMLQKKAEENGYLKADYCITTRNFDMYPFYWTKVRGVFLCDTHWSSS